MKKGFMKALAAVAAGAILLTMSLSAFALSYDVATVYDAQGTSEVTVSNILAAAGEEVAFLVESESAIVYIDQKTADGSGNVADFSFVVDNGDYEIRVGSTGTANSAATTFALAQNKATVNGFDVTVSAADAAIEAGNRVAIEAGAGFVKVYTLAAAGWGVAGYTVNGEEGVAIENGEFFTVEVTANAAIEVLFTQDKDAMAPITGTPVATAAPAQPAFGENKAGVLATATSATEYGILLTQDAAALDAISVAADVAELSEDEGDVRKFVALAKNAEGQYAVVVQNVEGDWYACAYAVNGDDLAKTATTAFSFGE